MEQTDIENVRKMMLLVWTNEQEIKIGSAFGLIDEVMYECEKENKVEQWKALRDARKILHDITLANTFTKEFIGKAKEFIRKEAKTDDNSNH